MLYINFENRGQNWSVIFHSCVENFAEDIKSSEKATKNLIFLRFLERQRKRDVHQ